MSAFGKFVYVNGPPMHNACNCVGPQPGETLCPCMLRGRREEERRMLEGGITIAGRRYKLVPED